MLGSIKSVPGLALPLGAPGGAFVCIVPKTALAVRVPHNISRTSTSRSRPESVDGPKPSVLVRVFENFMLFHCVPKNFSRKTSTQCNLCYFTTKQQMKGFSMKVMTGQKRRDFQWNLCLWFSHPVQIILLFDYFDSLAKKMLFRVLLQGCNSYFLLIFESLKFRFSGSKRGPGGL